ncbi:hypothetical protein [Candidatus Macondimonas diazotrophica]|jgi:hypothetical protein|uniref:Uncharacterized protein n=1 Tax=Candidatus Macondimonas diazotrophica TaxID=2305248 RepID=A0A4Z0FAX0_9GAMM|nr:hypothetical protein [Candidatus Macondimonas diazotrophica]TFZ83081.1 hypothetical protein E4680_05460 [Candidatus Macondimonas diazotrophica]HBG52281.1 hypothetical protein [Gammaproteobacteria bacterium]
MGAREFAEQHLLDATGTKHGVPEMAGRLACRGGAGAWLEFGEAETGLRLVLGHLLPEVSHLLRVDFPCDQAKLRDKRPLLNNALVNNALTSTFCRSSASNCLISLLRWALMSSSRVNSSHGSLLRLPSSSRWRF